MLQTNVNFSRRHIDKLSSSFVLWIGISNFFTCSRAINKNFLPLRLRTAIKFNDVHDLNRFYIVTQPKNGLSERKKTHPNYFPICIKQQRKRIKKSFSICERIYMRESTTTTAKRVESFFYDYESLKFIVFFHYTRCGNLFHAFSIARCESAAWKRESESTDYAARAMVA